MWANISLYIMVFNGVKKLYINVLHKLFSQKPKKAGKTTRLHVENVLGGLHRELIKIASICVDSCVFTNHLSKPYISTSLQSELSPHKTRQQS